MSQLADRILSAFQIVWLINFESVLGPYTFRFLHHMTHWLWVGSRTVYFPLFTSYDSFIMSQFQDRILSSFKAIWLIDYESAPGPYTFRFLRHMTHRLWVSLRTVYFPHLHLWFIDYPGPYTFAGPYTFLHKTVYFQILRTVYFRRPYSFSQKTV